MLGYSKTIHSTNPKIIDQKIYVEQGPFLNKCEMDNIF